MTQNYIIDWFEKKGSIRKEDIAMEDNYIERGYIDSFGFLELIQNCEDHFKIKFCDSDFEDENIFTVIGLIKIIENKR